VTWSISAFVLTIIATEFWKGTRARARIEGEGYAWAFYHLVTRNRRRWGGYIVHVAIVMIFLAFAGAAYNVDVRRHMNPGESVDVVSPLGHTYTVTYEGLSTNLNRGDRNLLWQAIATVSVAKNGVPKGIYTTEKRQYTTQVGQPPMTEVGIRSTPYEDLYLILSALDDTEAAIMAESAAQGLDLQILIKPLVMWIWLGCLTLVIGTVIALWPSVDRRRMAEDPTGSAEPAVVGAAD
jgi:cytochrome c-type biogenesis protein CcmF